MGFIVNVHKILISSLFASVLRVHTACPSPSSFPSHLAPPSNDTPPPLIASLLRSSIPNNNTSPLSPSSSLHLFLPRQRQPRPRTNIQLLRHPIQQALVFNALPALQQLDICQGGIDRRGQLLLRQLVGILGTTGADRVADFRAGFLGHDDVV